MPSSAKALQSLAPVSLGASLLPTLSPERPAAQAVYLSLNPSEWLLLITIFNFTQTGPPAPDTPRPSFLSHRCLCIPRDTAECQLFCNKAFPDNAGLCRLHTRNTTPGQAEMPQISSEGISPRHTCKGTLTRLVSEVGGDEEHPSEVCGALALFPHGGRSLSGTLSRLPWVCHRNGGWSSLRTDPSHTWTRPQRGASVK